MLRVFIQSKNNSSQNLSSLKSVQEKIQKHFSSYYLSEDPMKIIANICTKRNYKIFIAESCTGGLLAKRITDMPGSSAYFQGAVISYANEVKENILQIPKGILEKYGAVSKECAKAMIEGLRAMSIESHFTLAITGIAGPSGGSSNKPVGTVYIAIANSREEKTQIRVREIYYTGQRKEIQEAATNIAAFELSKEILNYETNYNKKFRNLNLVFIYLKLRTRVRNII